MFPFSSSTRTRVTMGLARRAARFLPHLASRTLGRVVFVVGFNNSGKSTIARHFSNSADVLLYPDEGNAELWFKGFYPWIRAPVKIPPIWTDPDRFVATVVNSREDGFVGARAQLAAFQFLNRGELLLHESGMLAALLPAVLPLFPQARVVHVVRNGALSSYLTARLEWTAIMRAPAKYLDQGCPIAFSEVLDRMAHYWSWTVDRVDATVPSDQLLEVRYEDLYENTAGVFEQIATFLEVETPKVVEHGERQVSGDDLSHFIAGEITERERSTLMRSLATTLARKGYRIV